MAGAHPDATAWVNLADGSELTFGEWDAEANRLARGLGQRDWAPGTGWSSPSVRTNRSPG